MRTGMHVHHPMHIHPDQATHDLSDVEMKATDPLNLAAHLTVRSRVIVDALRTSPSL